MIAKQKAAEVQLKVKIENFKLEVEKSESLDELENIISSQDSDFVENLDDETNERVEKKRESFEEIDEPINLTIQTILVTQMLAGQRFEEEGLEDTGDFLSSNNRMPDELVLGPNEYEEIDAIGRWKLEHNLIEEHCSPLEPEFRKNPGTHRIDSMASNTKLC